MGGHAEFVGFLAQIAISREGLRRGIDLLGRVEEVFVKRDHRPMIQMLEEVRPANPDGAELKTEGGEQDASEEEIACRARAGFFREPASGQHPRAKQGHEKKGGEILAGLIAPAPFRRPWLVAAEHRRPVKQEKEQHDRLDGHDPAPAAPEAGPFPKGGIRHLCLDAAAGHLVIRSVSSTEVRPSRRRSMASWRSVDIPPCMAISRIWPVLSVAFSNSTRMRSEGWSISKIPVRR